MHEALSSVLPRTHSLVSSGTSIHVFANVLKSCASILDASLGKALHSSIVKKGHICCQMTLKALLNMYAKCEALQDCQNLCNEINCHDAVTWNILLSGFAGTRKHDFQVMRLFNLFHASQNPRPSAVTFAIVLPVFTRSNMLNTGMSMHAHALKSGMESQTLVGNVLVSMYAKCGLLLDASAVFHEIADKDVVSYNALIAGLSQNKVVGEAFRLFCEMTKGPASPNYGTIASILPICPALGDTIGYKVGKEIHCYVLRRTELDEEVTVSNALLSFYMRIGRIREGQSAFHRMKFRDVVSWNSLIAGYASLGEWLAALHAFREFVEAKIYHLDYVTIISILPVCAHLCNLQLGKEIHGYVFRCPALCGDTSIGNSLVNFYAKCGCIEAATQTFTLVPRKDLISWNTLLDAVGENLLETQFVDLLNRMLMDGVKADEVTILAVLRFCARLSRLRNVKESHGFALRYALLPSDGEPTVGNALIDAYAKCGNMEYASKLFENLSGRTNAVTCNSMISGYLSCGSHKDANMIFQKMSEKDLTTWNLIVWGYAQNGCPNEALYFFHKLQSHGLKPDDMSVVNILPVCGQMAALNFLKQCHGYSVRACFDNVHLTAALLDVYAKCGSLRSAYTLYQSTPWKDLVLFTAMLGGYAMHGMGGEAINVYHYMLECGVKPDHVVLTSVLSACRHSGLIKEGLAIFNSIEEVHQMKPSMEQYACVVDLLARGGRIKEAFSFLNQLPVAANANILGTLLSACKTHQDVDVGQFVADQLLKIGTSDIGNYVVLSNLYAADARWDGVLEMRRRMKMRDLKKPAGCSWIEVGRSKNVFVAGDYAHPNRSFIYSMLADLDNQIKDLQKSP